MFDILPNTITALLTILFPAFASYKAISTANPAHLIPWLTYFLVLTLFHTLEWTPPFSIVPAVLPLYAYLRLFVHVYLLLPGQTQGASFVYHEYIEPFIATYERQIESAIAQVHSVAKSLGVGNIERLWELVREQVFGVQPKSRSSRAAAAERRPPPPPASNSYVANLLGRFSAPTATGTGTGTGPGAAKGDVYGLLGSALAQATSSFVGSGGGGGGGRGANIVPGDVPSHERARYIDDQRRKLRDLLEAYDREAEISDYSRSGGGGGGGGGSVYRRNQSETEFDKIEHDEAARAPPSMEHRSSSGGGGGGWGGWFGGGGGGGTKRETQARSSGSDLAYGS